MIQAKSLSSMTNLKLLSLALLGILIFTGCATTPVFDTEQVEISSNLTPQKVLAEPTAHIDETVLWGGIILQTTNLEDDSQIEMLAYPLNNSQQPITEARARGRFIIQHQGILDPAVYAQGRKLTVLADISEIQAARIANSDYQIPVVLSRQLQLWPTQYGRTRDNIQFGIGISIHN